MKKRMLLGVSLLSLLAITGCNGLSNKDNIQDQAFKVTGVKDENIKSLARQTVIGLTNTSSLPTMSLYAQTFEGSELENIQSTLSKAEVLLSSENSSVNVQKQTSDRQGYLNKLEITYEDKNIQLYYNDVSQKVEEERDEVEKMTTFSGIALYNNEEYQFRFQSEEEKELNEVEWETTLKLYKDQSNYILVGQGSESERSSTEVSYEYLEVVNGVKHIEYEISIETSVSKKVVELEINNIEYEIEYSTHNGEEIILVELENDTTNSEKRGLFKKITTGETVTYELIR